MKIIIHENDGKNIVIPAPTPLACAIVGSRVVTWGIGRELNGVPKKSIRKFQRALQEALKQKQSEPLVEVESADGDIVEIFVE